ncbi:MAG TPA: TetR/AcrR family transcriptional regulator [Polyangia bacterium]|nr:TetR/AcrR family transcriptional regulator [Polyangia bacterium]
MSKQIATKPARQRGQLDGSARERLLAAADELFYREGVHTVGIDRVIERAGVAKASLYSTFGSKEELVLAYLHGRADRRRQRVLAAIAAHDSPRARILAVFDVLAARVAEPDFRGCAFVNALAEGEPGDSRLRRACDELRQWTGRLFASLARDLGAADHAALGRQLMLLYDGAVVGASMDRDPRVARQARAMAEALLEAVPRAPRARA